MFVLWRLFWHSHIRGYIATLASYLNVQQAAPSPERSINILDADIGNSTSNINLSPVIISPKCLRVCVLIGLVILNGHFTPQKRKFTHPYIITNPVWVSLCLSVDVKQNVSLIYHFHFMEICNKSQLWLSFSVCLTSLFVFWSLKQHGSV